MTDLIQIAPPGAMAGGPQTQSLYPDPPRVYRLYLGGPEAGPPPPPLPRGKITAFGVEEQLVSRARGTADSQAACGEVAWLPWVLIALALACCTIPLPDPRTSPSCGH